MPCIQSKSFHLVISKGSQPGQKHVMEGEGDETVDTLPGDLVFMLQQKPHARLRRSGMEPCCSKGHVLQHRTSVKMHRQRW